MRKTLAQPIIIVYNVNIMPGRKMSPFKSVVLNPKEAEELALTLNDIQNTYIEISEHSDFPQSCLQRPDENEYHYAMFITYCFIPPLYRNILNTAKVFYPEQAHLIEANPNKRREIKLAGNGDTLALYDRMCNIGKYNQWEVRVRDFDRFKQRKTLEAIANVLSDVPLRAFITLVNELDSKHGVNRIRAAEALLNRTGFPAQSEKTVNMNHKSDKTVDQLTDDELKFEIMKRMSNEIEALPEAMDTIQLPLKPVDLTKEALVNDIREGVND